MVEDRTRAGTGWASSCCATGGHGGAGRPWTLTYQALAAAQRFDQPALAQTYHHYRAVLEVRDAQLDAIEADLAGWCDQPPFADWQVARLAAYRGITRLGALTLASRGRRLAPVRPRQPVHGVLRPGAMRVLQRQPGPPWPAHQGRQRPPARPAGRVGLVLPAPALGRPWRSRRRQQGLDPAVVARAWAAQQRLCSPVPHLAARKHSKNIVVPRHRPGARRVPVGRDDRRLTRPPATFTARDRPRR